METSGAHTIKDALSDLANSKHTEAGHSNILQGLAGVVSVGLAVAGVSRDRLPTVATKEGGAVLLVPALIALVDVVGPTNFDAWADQVKADGTRIRVI